MTLLRIGRISLLFATLLLAAALPLQSIAQESGKKNEKGKKPPASKNKEAEPEIVKRAILVLPPDTKGGITDQLTDIITDVMKSRIAVSKEYKSVLFTRSLPTVRRALLEQTLASSDASQPFDKPEKMKKLAQVTGYNLVVVSSVDDYQYDSSKNEVTIIMSARLVDYSGDKPVVKSAAGDTAKSKPNQPKDKSEISVGIETARELTETLINQLLKPKTAPPAEK